MGLLFQAIPAPRRASSLSFTLMRERHAPRGREGDGGTLSPYHLITLHGVCHRFFLRINIGRGPWAGTVFGDLQILAAPPRVWQGTNRRPHQNPTTPCTFEDKDTGETHLRGFRAVPVFAYEDTDGQDDGDRRLTGRQICSIIETCDGAAGPA